LLFFPASPHSQFNKYIINALLGVIDRIFELDGTEVRALWSHIDGLFPMFGSLKQLQIQLIVSSNGSHPTHKGTIKNIMIPNPFP
jgi:hypothetical protein